MKISKLIKIKGKSWFDQLTPEEVALMIDSFIEGGNEFFDSIAFDDFLHAKLNIEWIKKIQEDLNENAFIPSETNDWPDINKDYLLELSSELKKNKIV